MTLNVVPLPVNNLNNIPEMLRKLADGMESGEYELPDSFVYAMQGDDGFYTGILGQIEPLGAMGLLTLAQQFLGAQLSGWEE
jgi:hypothetical protein